MVIIGLWVMAIVRILYYMQISLSPIMDGEAMV